jgi:hypothetical protein
MEIGILVFDGTRAAEDALADKLDAEGDRRPWLHEVGVVARPVLGRLTIRASYPENKEAVYREGDIANEAGDITALTSYVLAGLAGPLRAPLIALETAGVAQARVSDKEKKLFRIDELKEILPRASSAVVLIAEPKVIDEMVEMFATDGPMKTIRRNVGEELRKRLRALRDQSLEQVAQTLGGEPAPAMH